MGLVGVDKVAQAFKKSEREVQRLVIFHGMPRETRGKYDLGQCLLWYLRHLHKKACGCAGPCDGFDFGSRNTTNARAERKKALAESLDIADELVGLDSAAIRERLTDAVRHTFDSFDFTQEKK